MYYGSIDVFFKENSLAESIKASSNPKVIEGYYMEVLQHLGGCPRTVRGHLGTENGNIRDFHRVLVPTDQDGTLDIYLEGASTTNQRIEYWWRFLRSQCVEFWLSLFADLRDNGFFDGGFLDKSLQQFCCMVLIQVS